MGTSLIESAAPFFLAPKSIAAVLAVLMLTSAAVAGEALPLVRPGEAGLVYRATESGDTIPEFSYSGYRGGGVALPSVPVRATLEPSQGADDDTARIQKAIDELSAAAPGGDGFRGALLLKAGNYRVADTLRISASGVVLRGEPDTVIIATGKKQRPLILIEGGKPGAPIPDSKHIITQQRIAVGSRTLQLENTAGLGVGDDIEVVRIASDAWLAELGTDKLNRGPDDPVKNWTSEEYTLASERRIVAIEGNTITIDAPIVCAIEERFGGGYIRKTQPDARIREVGIESLRLVSEYVKGQEKLDEKHAWDAVKINCLADGWVRDVTAKHFGYSCVNISARGKRITVQDCACLDPVSQITGGRRYSFALDGQLCLVQRCYTRNGRHDYVMHARARGPNVFLDCVADEPHSDSGPHHRWSTGTLYDNIACGALNVQNRKRSGSGHGWAGANMVFWNCRTVSVSCEKPPTANNYAIGCTGDVRGNGHIESKGRPVEPRSLYLTQLRQRLGDQALLNVTTPQQRTGTLDKSLRAMHRSP